MKIFAFAGFSTVFPILFLVSSVGLLEGSWFFTLFDDAMISMTYARTLAETGELVWYPGAPRVQGFTNLLWTLYMALLHTLGLTGSNISAIISITSILSIFFCSISCARLVDRSLPRGLSLHRESWVYMTAVLVPILFPLVFWSLRGMEVGVLSLFSVLIVSCSLLYEQTKRSPSAPYIAGTSVVVSVLGVLVRLDFLPLVFSVSIALFVLTESRRKLAPFILIQLTAATLTFILVLTFQYIYYGDVLPNTYQLKMVGYSASDRIAVGLQMTKRVLPLVALVVGSGLLALSQLERPLSKLILLSSAVFLTTVAYSIWVGGDAWEFSWMPNRYITVGLPCAVVSVLLGLYMLCYDSSIKMKEFFIVLFFLVICFFYMSVFWSTPSPLNSESLLPYMLIVAMIISSAVVGRVLLLAKSDGRSFRYCVVTMLWCLVSGWGFAQWMQTGGLHVRDDFGISIQGLDLKRVTATDAVIATVWAGAPAYYSQRRMIDLLGKSDREIASLQPRGKIYPGHNKWDYQYSIGINRPDIVFQLWQASANDKENLRGWGYEELCLDGKQMGYYLMSSGRVRWDLLTPC
jgi:hypothetical protein